MDKQQIIHLMGLKAFKKFTGPPEHWLTTFHTKFWGLEQKHDNKWGDIQVGDLFVFHSTSIEYLEHKAYLPTGIIGVGIVGGLSVKQSLEWIGEIQNNNNTWPLLIHFSEIWWFGDYENVKDEDIKTKIGKGAASILDDLVRLTHSCITFQEMRNNNCAIPAQGSVSNISDESRSKLVKIISTRLIGAVVGDPTFSRDLSKLVKPSLINTKEDIISNLAKSLSKLSDINLDETDEEATEREKKMIQYELNQKAQDDANKNHQNTVYLIASELKKHGITPKQSFIDVYAENNGQIFIFEVKSVHTKNFNHQTRNALGQLLEYEYFQVKKLQGNQGKTN